MNNNLVFTEKAWEEYCYWQTQDKKILKKINRDTYRYKKKFLYRNRKTRTFKK